MLPILLKIGPLYISAAGFFMVLAFLSASFLIWREAKREYLDEEGVMDLFLLSVVVGLMGARVSYILLYPQKFGIHILRWLLPTWRPGFYIYGGLGAAFAAAYLLSGRKNIELSRFLDAAIMAVLPAAVLYKIGQFLDGSLVGRKTTGVLGLPVVGETGRYIPVALIEAILLLASFVLLVRLRRYFLVEAKIRGGLFLGGTVLACLVEIVAYFLVRDKVYWGELPISLMIAVCALVASSVLLYRKIRVFKQDARRILGLFGK